VQKAHPISKRCRIASAQPSPPTAVSEIHTSRGKNPERVAKGKSVDQSAPGPKRAKPSSTRAAEVVPTDKGGSSSVAKDAPRLACSLYSVGQRVEGDFAEKGPNLKARSKWYVGSVVQVEGEGSEQAITVLYDEDDDEQEYSPEIAMNELRSHHYCDLTVLPPSVRSVTLSAGSRVRVKAADGAEGWTLGTVNNLRWDLGKHVRPGEMGDLKLAVLCDDPNGIDYPSFAVGREVEAEFDVPAHPSAHPSARPSADPSEAAVQAAEPSAQQSRWYRGVIRESVKFGNRLQIKVYFPEGTARASAARATAAEE
jgi:hypothetical protein